jgi:N-acetylglucosaminyldiphosphoundecaprenol N-acetyl-beta-D-mannosaminyltransferase
MSRYTEKVMDIDVTTLNYSGLIKEINSIIEENKKANIVAVNPEKFIAMENNPELRRLISQATFKIPDGIGVILASKIKGGSIQSRITGVDLLEEVLKLANLNKYKIFLYGGKENVVRGATDVISVKYPHAQIVGFSDGYEKDQEKLIKNINDSGAQIIFVALGSPKQELWIEENMSRLHTNIYQGVGGSFDVISGNVQRAPEMFRKAGLEWLYRLTTQPSRFRRQLALPKFLVKVMFHSNKK